MRTSVHFLLWAVGLAKAETQTTERERDCLAKYAERRHRLVEIGTWHGVTTLRLRRAMAPDGTLFAVDPYPVGRLGFSYQRPIALRETRKSRNGGITWIRKTGRDAAKETWASQSPVDFIFIDGDHSYEGLRGDWEGWNPLVGAGGIVALHDSRSTEARRIDQAGSVIYTRNVISKDSNFELVDEVDSLSVFRKRPPAD